MDPRFKSVTLETISWVLTRFCKFCWGFLWTYLGYDDFVFSCEVDAKSVGQSKAKSVCAFLQELNDSVNARFIEENPDTLITTNPSFFSQFTLVIATQVPLGFYFQSCNLL